MLKIAITGNIGSGKSLLTSFIKKLGGVTVSCDDLNRELLKEKSYIKEIAKVFPSCVNNGVLDKESLKTVVFSSREKLAALNALAHPRIKRKVKKFFKDNSNANCVYVEVPLLFESGMQKTFDKIWLVTASKENSVERAKKRDGADEKYLNKVLSKQIRFDSIPTGVCEVFENDGTPEELFEKVKDKYIPSFHKNYTHLFLDLDNTILDFNRAEMVAFSAACKEYGIQTEPNDHVVYNALNREQWERYERNEIEKKDIFINRFNNFFAYKNVSKDATVMNELYFKHLSLQAFYVKGAKRGIKKLKEKYTLCLISNGNKFIQNSRLKISGLDNLLDKKYVSDEIGVSKPNKGFFDYCFEDLKTNKENVLVIGDSNTSDMKGAFDYGLDAIYYEYYGSPCLYPRIAVFDKWSDLVKYLV